MKVNDLLPYQHGSDTEKCVLYTRFHLYKVQESATLLSGFVNQGNDTFWRVGA